MKLLTYTLTALLLLISTITYGQINDCALAQVVCDSADLAFNPDGPGENDYADPDNDEGCITALEQNSAWYYFQISALAPPNLVLGFIIHPKGGLGEDYDWALYGPNVNCGDLGSPIRCSSSSAACGFCPETGMGMGTTDVTEGPGTGDGFVMTLIVQPGQGFYLLVDNWQGTDNGFILEWTDTAEDYLNCDASPPCALNATAGLDIEICEGDPPFDLDGGSTGNHGNETYSWTATNGGLGFLNDPNISDPTVTLPDGFTGVITYTLTVVEDTCMNEDQVDVLVNPLPTVNINPIAPVCENHAPIILTATPPGGVWGGANTGNNFNPATQGPGIHTVTYTFTDGNGCMKMESIDIEVYEKPVVTIDPAPAEFCDSDNMVLLSAEGSDGAGGYEFSWNGPPGMMMGDTYQATLGGLYSITVTDDNGCTNTSSTTVVSNANPTVEIIDPGQLCITLGEFTLTATPPGGTFSGSYVDPNGILLPEMIPAGTFTVTYTYVDSHNCEGTDDANITIINIPNAFANNNSPVCAGQPILLTGTTDLTGNTITYLWLGPNGYVSTEQNPTNATVGGPYEFEVTVDNCTSLPATTIVNVIATPDAIALNSGPYCNGESIQLLASSGAPGNLIYAWSGPNGYTSDVQNPSDATLPGNYSVVITAGTCSSVPAQTTVVFSAPPDATAANTGPYCVGEAISLLGNTTTSGTAITYAWSGPNGYTSTNQNPTDAVASGTYQLIVDVDGCGSNPVMTNVVVNTPPQPVITGQNVFCTGFSSTLDAGTGYQQYLWNDMSQGQTLIVNTSGNYAVTVTDANGCTGSASFMVSELASLSPVIVGTLEFCEGSASTLDAGSGYTQYNWSSGQQTQTISVAAQDNYSVTVTDQDGCTGSTNVTTVVNSNPMVLIGGSSSYCIGGYTVLDAGSYASYVWSNDSTTQTITVATPGVFSVDVIDQNGCSGSGSVTVEESTMLHPVITGFPAFCENGSTTLNAGSGFTNYAWSDGSDQPTLAVSAIGTYSVTVTDATGCSGSSTVAVVEVAPPTAVLQPQATLCNTTAGGSVVDLYSLILSGDNTGSWVDADQSNALGAFNSLDFNTVPAGDYHFEYTTNSAITPCPEASYTIVISVVECKCPDVFFLNANPLCNEAGSLDLSSIENTTENGSWSLIQTPVGGSPASLNGTLFNATDGDPGDYTFQFTLQNQPPPGCPLDYQATIHVDASVDAGTALAPVDFCFDEGPVVTLTSLITGADPNGIWTETSVVPTQNGGFNASNGTFNTDNQTPNTYTFEYKLNSQGACPADASMVSVIINPLPNALIANPASLDCVQPQQSLDAGGSSSGGSYSITWNGPGIIMDGNEGTLYPSIDKAGTYLLTITNTQTGCVNTASVLVTGNAVPPSGAVINAQDPSCFGDENGLISVSGIIGGTPPYQYSLNNSVTGNNPNYSQLVAGPYALVVEDANGCKWDTLITLVEPPVISIDLGPDIEIGLGETAIVKAVVNLSSSQMDTVIWSPEDVIECIDVSCLEAIIHAYNTITIKATLYDEFGCATTDEVVITLNKNRKIYFPTAFSPNGDGINDIFYILGHEDQIIKIRKFAIFNRWGNQVFEALDFRPNEVTQGWNGMFKNALQNPAVFVYTAEVEYIDGVVEVYSGDVTLIR